MDGRTAAVVQRVQRLLQCVERTGANVAVDDAEGAQHERPQPCWLAMAVIDAGRGRLTQRERWLCRG
jgi:hypothetical protein